MVENDPITYIPVPKTIKNSIKLVSKTLNEGLSLYAHPVSVKKTKDIPKEIHDWLNTFIRSNPVEIFGSLGMQSYAPHARKPGDLDAVVDNPEYIARTITSKLQAHGYDAMTYRHPWKGGWQVKIRKNNIDTVIADLHPKQGHTVRYAEYGFTKKPSLVGGVLIQEAEDQLLRKANNIMHKQGVGSHRIAKDVEDFVVIANTMLDSKQLRAQAKMAQVTQAKKELAKILEYAKSVKGIDAQSKKRMVKDPIPAALEKRVIAYAKSNPEIDVRDIVKLPNMISHTTRVPKRNPPELADMYPSVAEITGQKTSSNQKDKRRWSAIPGMFSWKV
jgi:hypothetical protein